MPPRHPQIARALGLFGQVIKSHPPPALHHLHIACSGGPDSMALLGLARIASHRLKFRLSVGHIHHGLRPESNEEAAMVTRFCRENSIPIEVTRLDLPLGSGLPARAREARRQALHAQAERFGAQWIALGHTATDQVETLLMNLVRGCGMDGLAAMPQHDHPWIRPLLHLSRSETRALCQLLALPFVDDPTNMDLDHKRVRYRNQILPIMRADNPRIEQAVVQLCRQLAEGESALQEWAKAEEYKHREGQHKWSITGFAQLPPAIRSRMLRHMCLQAGADMQALRSRLIEEIDTAVVAMDCPQHPSHRAPRTWHLRPSLVLHLQRGFIWLKTMAT